MVGADLEIARRTCDRPTRLVNNCEGERRTIPGRCERGCYVGTRTVDGFKGCPEQVLPYGGIAACLQQAGGVPILKWLKTGEVAFQNNR